MGCDGGTIPKRKEIVKDKPKQVARDKNADLAARWQCCALTGLKLRRPIVACQLGRLYNKDAILKHLLDSSTATQKPKNPDDSTSASSSLISHIRSLKDVKELNLKEKNDFDSSHQTSSGSETIKAQFHCPISGLDFNGKYKFLFIWTCGCVLSERALKEVADRQKQETKAAQACLVCSKLFLGEDLIVINGNDKEMNDLKARMRDRRSKVKSSKGKSSTGNNSDKKRELLETGTSDSKRLKC